MGWKPDHKRVKPKTARNPNSAEMKHQRRVRQLPCYGCEISGGIEFHHTMMRFHGKAGRRDHRYGLPLCGSCHRGRFGVHGIGSETTWLERIGKDADETIDYIFQLWEESNA